MSSEFARDELASIRAGIKQVASGSVEASHPAMVVEILRVLWGDAAALLRLRHPARLKRITQPDWLLGMTDEFVKSVTAIDRNLQGRVLEAISYLVQAQTLPKGDTVKPLTGALKKLWRYRIGDYRLVYFPDIKGRKIFLVEFTSRQDAYEA